MPKKHYAGRDDRDRRLLEQLAMNASDQTRELARRLIWEIVRSGFTQLRKTDAGHLYGSGSYRFTLPYSVVQGSCTIDMLRELRDKFAIVKTKRDANEGVVKPALPEFDVVENPEDLIRDMRERVDAMHMEAERTAPDVATVVGEGSTPSGLPNGGLMVSDPPGDGASEGSSPSTPATPTDPQREDEETSMAKTATKSWECPDCHQRFKQAGRHPQSCPARGTSTRTEDKPERRRKSPVSRPRAHTNGGDPVDLGEVTATLNGWQDRLKAFEVASLDMVALIRDMNGQIVFYKRAAEEYARIQQQLSAIFERPKVPRID